MLLLSLIKRGANVNAQNNRGETPMHGAALKNHYLMIERLIEAGGKVCWLFYFWYLYRNGDIAGELDWM